MEQDYYSNYSNPGYDANASAGGSSNYYSGTEYPTAYSSTDPANTAALGMFFGGFMIFMIILAAIFYVFYAVCFMKIAQKTNTPNAWFAWVPILNVVLMVQIAKKPLWWILLLFIPFVNIVISILLYMEIAKAVGKPEWLGILMIVPVANLVIPAYLAFSKNEAVFVSPPQQPGATLQ